MLKETKWEMRAGLVVLWSAANDFLGDYVQLRPLHTLLLSAERSVATCGKSLHLEPDDLGVFGVALVIVVVRDSDCVAFLPILQRHCFPWAAIRFSAKRCLRCCLILYDC